MYVSRGLTQEELAHRARLDYSYVNQIENGRRNPSLDAISRIARALGVPVRDRSPSDPHAARLASSAARGRT